MRTVTSVAIAGLLAPRPTLILGGDCPDRRPLDRGSHRDDRMTTATCIDRVASSPLRSCRSARLRCRHRAGPGRARDGGRGPTAGRLGIAPSVGRKGDAYDNAIAEAFASSLITGTSSRGAASPPTSMRSTTRSAGSAGTTAGACTRCWAASLCSSTSCSPPPPANPSTQHELQNRTALAAAAALGNASRGYHVPRIGRCPPPARRNRPCQIAEPPPDPTRPR
jgi:hypothetical protein